MNNKYTDQITRFTELLSHYNITAAELSKRLGNKFPTSFYNYAKGSYRLPESVARQIVEQYPDISFEWMYYGLGNMLVKDNQDEQELIATLKKQIAKLEQVIEQRDITINNLSQALERLTR